MILATSSATHCTAWSIMGRYSLNRPGGNVNQAPRALGCASTGSQFKSDFLAHRAKRTFRKYAPRALGGWAQIDSRSL
jgi:hypothetical protein